MEINDNNKKTTMKEFKLDPKFLITIGTIVVVMAGFYYTTSYRLDSLEKKVDQLEGNNEAIIRLEERLKIVQAKTDEIYRHIIGNTSHIN